MILRMHACRGREGSQKFRLFVYVIIPNQERVVKKIGKLLKHSYLNQLLDVNILAKLEAATWGAP